MQPIIPISEPDEQTALLTPTATELGKQTVYIYLAACLSAIGGFLFGYDTGIISGAMLFMREEFDLNELWQESVVSSTLLTAWLFSILSGSVNDKYGRKPVIITSSIIFAVGSILLAFAWSKSMLVIGRLVVGGGVGFASMTAPMYIAELAPASIRGQLLLINMCCITGGQFVASIIAYAFSFVNDGWRYMLGIAAVPALVQLAAFVTMPESPRWLVANKRFDEAHRVLRRIRPIDADVDAEFEAICATNAKSRQEQHQLIASIDLSAPQQVSKVKNSQPSTFRRILAHDACRRALVVGCLLQLVQQASGVNTVMYYSASIIQMSGVHSPHQALLLASSTALVNFVFTIVGYLLVERAGRRKLLLFSLAGVTLSLIVLGAGFQFADYKSALVTAHDPSEQNSPCSQYPDCSSCTRNDLCGFCFADIDEVANSNQFASCFKVNENHKDLSLLGNCSDAKRDTESIVWAYGWCPSAYSWLIVLGMVSYLFFFAPGMGPMPWTINSEIYPSWARSWCLSAATSVNWLFNLLVSMTFLSLTRAITKQGTFYLYAAIALVGLVYFSFVLPETRGKSLEELETLFASNKKLRPPKIYNSKNQPHQQSEEESNNNINNNEI